MPSLFLFWVKQQPVELIIFSLFILSVAVQLFYFFFFFIRLISYKPVAAAIVTEGVSVVVAAHNEAKNLARLLPVLLAQDYPDFEIIIANDRSTDETRSVLAQYMTVKVITIKETPEGVNSKKYALTKAIELASKKIILVTDADCLPLSRQWVRRMASNFTDGKELVLGYCPYEERKGFLNSLIRYETFYTAVQYLSFALAGRPYMGVGRNMAYKRELFEKNNGFKSHEGVTGGDDDLFINEVATNQNVAVELNIESQVVSYPKTNYKDWIKQKTRHLAAGKYYKPQNKVLTGILAVSMLFFYGLTIVLLSVNFLSSLIIILFLFRTFVLICSFALISKKLKDNFNTALFPILDFVYAINYLVVGIRALRKNTKWI